MSNICVIVYDDAVLYVVVCDNKSESEDNKWMRIRIRVRMKLSENTAWIKLDCDEMMLHVQDVNDCNDVKDGVFSWLIWCWVVVYVAVDVCNNNNNDDNTIVIKCGWLWMTLMILLMMWQCGRCFVDDYIVDNDNVHMFLMIMTIVTKWHQCQQWQQWQQ